MTAPDHFAELLRLMPAPPAVVAADWKALEQQWGTRFPVDYMRFIDVYGQGSIRDYLAVARPLGGPQPEDCDSVGGGDRPYPEPSGLMTWGANPDGDACFFKTADDPGDWTVVVWRRHHRFNEPTSTEHPFGFVEFLVRTFNGELAANPFSGTDLWNHPSPTFESEEW